MRTSGWFVLAFVLFLVACAKPLVQASTDTLPPVERAFAASPNEVYYAIRWALSARGYPVAFEDLPGGMVSSAWVPATADSHFVSPFGRRDYGATALLYHQLELHVLPGGETTTVSVASHVKHLIANVQSSGREENAVLDEVANYLHGRGLEVSNTGVE